MLVFFGEPEMSSDSERIYVQLQIDSELLSLFPPSVSDMLEEENEYGMPETRVYAVISIMFSSRNEVLPYRIDIGLAYDNADPEEIEDFIDLDSEWEYELLEDAKDYIADFFDVSFDEEY